MTKRARVSADERRRDDLVCALLAAVVVAGLFVDGWNHINLQGGALGGFFTIWHGLLYAGFAATAIWLARNDLLMAPGSDRPDVRRLVGRRSMRYPSAVAGLALAMVGMLGDAVWHTIFGEETGVARVIAPFHLCLFTGALLILAATWRRAWYDRELYPTRPSWAQFAPVFVSIVLLMAAISFMFQWLSAFMEWEPSLGVDHIPAALAARVDIRNTVEYAGVARVFCNTIILCIPPIMVLRRWVPPHGALTGAFTIVALAMSALTEFRLGWTVLAAVLAGAGTELTMAVAARRSGRARLIRAAAVAMPLVLWVSYFQILSIAYDIAWPFDLWFGATLLSMLFTVAVSFLVLPPTPGPTWKPTVDDERSSVRPEARTESDE